MYAYVAMVHTQFPAVEVTNIRQTMAYKLKDSRTSTSTLASKSDENVDPTESF